jgi:hypothetical protein
MKFLGHPSVLVDDPSKEVFNPLLCVGPSSLLLNQQYLKINHLFWYL